MRQCIQFCASPDGVRIAFAKSGKGPPLVRVASWFTHLDLDAGSPVWRHWIEELSAGRTLIRYDPRGAGLSDRNVGDFAMDRWVADLAAVADAAGLTRFALLGLCQGGAVAAAYAARYPERVSRLILCNSYASGAYSRRVPGRFAREARALAQMIEIGWGKESGAFRELFASLLVPDAGREVLRWIGDMQRRSASARNAHLLWDAFHRFDIYHEASNIRAPTLIFHALGDAMVPFEAGRHLASRIPGARFVPLKSNNHILMHNEGAWANFCREVNEFLKPDEAVVNGACNAALDGLTPRETEILGFVARGLSNQEVAGALRISEKTVRNHLTTVFSKLGVTSRAQAIVTALDAGLGRG